ncbi:MAG TPA: hypothetical protein VNX25_00100 [Verrucomicrobiae bacterium]|nr:hypothetical protein [Verrucomicrobiae bacterium]
MKRLLAFGGPGLITSALLDLLFQWGVGRPLPLARDTAMAAAGAGCIYLLVRYRKEL